MASSRKTIPMAGLFVAAIVAFSVRVQAQQVSPPISGFAVTYSESGQFSSEIRILGFELTHSSTRCNNTRMEQNCSNPTTESTKVELNPADVQQLMAVIQSSGFLQLKDIYGNTSPGSFSYPKSITVKTGEATKKVEYRGGAGVEPEPDTFAAVEKIVTDLASRTSVANLGNSDQLSDSKVLMGQFVAGRVQGHKFFPFDFKGTGQWDGEPHDLASSVHGQKTKPQFIDLSPYEGKTIFLDVGQPLFFYEVKVLGSCNAALGKALWEATWDRGGLVGQLLNSVQQSNVGKMTIAADDPKLPPRPHGSPAATTPPPGPASWLDAGVVDGELLHRFTLGVSGVVKDTNIYLLAVSPSDEETLCLAVRRAQGTKAELFLLWLIKVKLAGFSAHVTGTWGALFGWLQPTEGNLFSEVQLISGNLNSRAFALEAICGVELRLFSYFYVPGHYGPLWDSSTI